MNVDDVIAERIEAARRKAEDAKRRRAELAAARTAGVARRHTAKLNRQGQTPSSGFGVRVYRRHNCQAVHATWADFAQCIWPAAETAGNGPYAAVACAARTVTLYSALPTALASKRGLDRDSCGPDCANRHLVVALNPGPDGSGAAA
ncbi:hypothetical protein ACFYZB_04155 [Streptomyces sp. NPDC001852]|uniref:hypothetical protein n=1 Tax=Streptomyces sp. NPDC001852 TaxID=3364619 RepID=UPI0036A9380C